jgi:hypothetical protein
MRKEEGGRRGRGERGWRGRRGGRGGDYLTSFQVLKWAAKKGLALDGTLYCWAIQNQNLSPKKLMPVLDWLQKSGFKMLDEQMEMLEFAAVYPDTCALDWLINFPEFSVPKEEIIQVLVKHATSPKMEWLVKNYRVKIEKFKASIISNALMKEDLTLLETFKTEGVSAFLDTSGDPRIRNLAKKGKYKTKK